MQGCSESLPGSSEAAGFLSQETVGGTENCKEKATIDHTNQSWEQSGKEKMGFNVTNNN